MGIESGVTWTNSALKAITADEMEEKAASLLNRAYTIVNNFNTEVKDTIIDYETYGQISEQELGDLKKFSNNLEGILNDKEANAEKIFQLAGFVEYKEYYQINKPIYVKK
jgi:hypothetical protein